MVEAKVWPAAACMEEWVLAGALELGAEGLECIIFY